jgi:hypothetical protein
MMSDASVTAALINLKSKAAALRFRSQQDALDYAAHSVQDMNRLLASNSLNAIDRYVKGDVGCYLRCHSRRSNMQGDLAFFSIPSTVISAGTRPAGADCIAGEQCNRPLNPERDKGAMFLGVTEIVNGPKGIVFPSFVWLETAKERRDFRWQILADSARAVDVVVKIDETISERKVGFFQPRVSAGQSAGVSSLIEGGSETVGNIEQDARQHLRQLIE